MNARARIPVLLLLLLLLPSCSREDRYAAERERIPIRFSCFSHGVEGAKADASFTGGTTLVDGQHFAVFGWDTGDDFLPDSPNPGTPDFWNGATPVDVTFHNNNDRGKNNTYDPAVLPDQVDQYWPRTDTPAYCYSFWAYYPYDAGGSNGIALRSFAANPSDGTVGIFDFTAQPDAADMVDFCVADVASDNVYGDTNSEWPGTVALSFHHALTRVQFKFVRSADVDEGTTIQLLEAQLKNVYTTGTLTVKYAQRDIPALGRPGTTTFAWSGQGTPSDFDITVGGVDPVDGTPGTYVTLVTSPEAPESSDILLMVPQTMLTSAAAYHQDLYLKWSVTNGSGTTTHAVTLLLDECHPSVGDPDFADMDWAPNRFVTYTILIGAKPIQFDEVEVKITPWSEDVTGYYPIIA